MINDLIVSGNGVFANRSRKLIISAGCNPTDTAAYKLFPVKRYSCKWVGRDNGSEMVVRKSCACGASGEKLSRVIVPLSGSIQRGRFAWSGLSGKEEKSLYPKFGSSCDAPLLLLNDSRSNLLTTSGECQQPLCRPSILTIQTTRAIPFKLSSRTSSS